jgi:lipid-A-disaccharide synthase
MTAQSVSDFRQKHGIAEQAGILVVLPGSRSSEIKFSLPDFGAALQQIIAANPNYRVVVPVVDHHFDTISQAVKNWPGMPVLVRGDADKYAAFRAATAALAVSGTVALELALCNLPAVIAYRIHPFTALLYRRLIKTPFANLVNIMAGAMAVPECIQENCTSDKLATEINRLLHDEQARAAQKVVLQAVRPWLSPADGHSPALKAAETILDVWQQQR